MQFHKIVEIQMEGCGEIQIHSSREIQFKIQQIEGEKKSKLKEEEKSI